MSLRRFIRFRSLQQKLGFYAFIISLMAMIAVSSLSYRVARKQVRQVREQLMESLAGAIAHEIEVQLKEAQRSLEMAAEMSHLRRSWQARDRRQLAEFFDDLVYGHREYDLLAAIDSDGRLFAANTRDAAGEPIAAEQFAGKPYRLLFPGLPDSWLAGALAGRVRGIDWGMSEAINRLHGREGDPSVPRERRHQVALVVPVRSEARVEPQLGALVMVLNWSHFQDILDHAERNFKSLDLATGYAFLDGSDANTTIGHKYRDLYGTTLVQTHRLPEVHERFKNSPHGTLRYRWREGWKIVALARIRAPDLGPPFNWYLGVGINERDIYAPVEHLRLWFIAIPLLVALCVVLLNLVIGRTISVSLTEFTQLARDAARGRFSQLAPARSDDEVGHLAQAFNEMLVSFRAQIPFNQIPNPYLVGNPIRTPEMFFGRHEDLEWIGQKLEHGGNKMILLYGPRRIGKTSLLHQIAAGRASSSVLPFFFDSQQIIPEIEQDGDFYHVLTRELLAQLSAAMPGLSAPVIAAERFSPDTLRKLLRFLSERAPGKRPVLLFDELENLEFKFARGSLTADVVLFLAGLLDADVPVSFVASGSAQLDKRAFPHWKILIPKTIPRRISLLSPRDAHRLIVEPVHGYVLYDEGIPERILRLTAGHPYYTQVVCQALVDCLNEDREFAAGLPQFSQAVDQVLNNPPPPLNDLWESFSAQEKIAAAALAQELPEEENFAIPDGVFQSLPPELRAEAGDLATLRAALENQYREDLLEKDRRGAYRFRIDLLRLWMRREYSVWQVADELQRSSGR